MICTILPTDSVDNSDFYNMTYNGSLDDLQAINAYLQQVQDFIDEIKIKHGV